MSILSGLGIVVFPLAEFVGGQLYKYGGYYAVYSTALSFTFIGVIYICFVPESVTQRTHTKNNTCKEGVAQSTLQNKDITLFDKAKYVFVAGNQTVVESYR